MLLGNDISNWQGRIDWSTFKDNINFVIAKATEGIGIIDAWYGNNRQQARDFNILRGWYHFAHPELNSAEDEANWFLKVCYDLQPGEILFLDYEPVNWNGDHVKWCKEFFDTISAKLNGYKAVLYTYQSMLTSHDWSLVAQDGHGLWIAAPTNDPNNNNFQTGAFPFAMMQQWGNESVPGVQGVVDADVFFGSGDIWKAYGLPNPTPPPPPPSSSPVIQPPSVSVPSPVSPTEPAPASPLPTLYPTPKTTSKTPFQLFIQALINWLKSFFNE